LKRHNEDQETPVKDLTRNSGLDLRLNEADLRLDFGPEVLHPAGEIRHLDQVRASLEDPQATGPDHLYTIYMDIARRDDLDALHAQGLLYGAVIYNAGTIGQERLRSQGHIHSEKPGTGLRYSEVYEFWSGQGLIYLQKECAPQVSEAYLIPVNAGDKVVIPYGWVHLVVTLGEQVVSFGAWCARANQLEYAALRALGGPAYFVQADGSLRKNPQYQRVAELRYLSPDDLPTLGIPRNRPIYTSWQEQPEIFNFMANPEVTGDLWANLPATLRSKTR
jgi:glucose-6-phosphate isomerase, archaeal